VRSPNLQEYRAADIVAHRNEDPSPSTQVNYVKVIKPEVEEDTPPARVHQLCTKHLKET